ncbi:hypothetical protein [Actinoplanes sp. NPDC049118]|uniref:hypothetical protein n=1 Tax=Actinoplanes sp. NPDC049118 TaxID=3155769 RepID=UPI0033C8C183
MARSVRVESRAADVPAYELGATTSSLTFFRCMGGAIGVSALGTVLASRLTILTTERFGPGSARRRGCPTLPPSRRRSGPSSTRDTAESFL